MANDPHIALPFNIPVAVDEQDELGEYSSAILCVLSFPLGHLDYNPEFGCRDLAFRPITDDLLGEIRSAVLRWVPDVAVFAEERPIEFEQLLRSLILSVQGSESA
jgi:hypothetical protein